VESCRIFTIADVVARDGRAYREFIRSADLSAGVYRLKAGAADTQSPHTEDEIYYVVSGRASFQAGARQEEVGPGAVLFVPAHQEHRFLDISEDLVVLVIFGPAEYSRREKS